MALHFIFNCLNLEKTKNLSIFKLKQFEIHQSEEVFKVGTDALLCGGLAQVYPLDKILEIGTGTAIIALMLAQKNSQVEITAIEPHLASFELAQLNVSESTFHNQISVVQSSLQEYQSTHKWDNIICNPPYFESHSPQHHTKDFARSQQFLNWEEIFYFCSHQLSGDGKIQIIFPYAQLHKVQEKAAKYSLHLHELVAISGTAQSPINRAFVRMGFGEKILRYSRLVVEESRGKYTEAYRQLTQSYHPHF